mmetsp:Transcript_39725/g.115949  ORF Transcript_39725/g.115949 Transcript_39725/m.115949 type:complete len:94 (+) Transcript_39725:1163-1444(+)
MRLCEAWETHPRHTPVRHRLVDSARANASHKTGTRVPGDDARWTWQLWPMHTDDRRCVRASSKQRREYSLHPSKQDPGRAAGAPAHNEFTMEH